MPLLLSAGAALAQPAVLRVVGSADPPFRVYGPQGPSGLYYELLIEAARRLGWTLQISEVPSVRALKMMELGDADLMMGPLYTPERERYLRYSQLLLPAEDKVFYSRPGLPAIRTLDDLPGRSIAVHRGKRYGQAFDGDSRLQRHELNDYRSAIEMVARGRLDLVVMPERQGDLLLATLGLNLLKQPLRLPGEAPHVVMSRASPWEPRLPELEKALAAMQADGSWRRIEGRY